MLCEKIYESALALLGESMALDDNTDYEERAPYIIAAFCSEAQDADKDWRRIFDLEAQSSWDTLCVPLEEEFPLSDRFANAAAFYLAAILVLDSDEQLSDKLYERFCDAISTIDSSLEEPTSDSNNEEESTAYILESIKNVYF